MRDAIHIAENTPYTLPISANNEEVANLKKPAYKGLFTCTYCEAKLNHGYDIPFTDALKVHNEFVLCNPPHEELERETFIKNNERILWEIAEEVELKSRKKNNVKQQRSEAEGNKRKD